MINYVTKFFKKLIVDLCWKLIQINSEKPVFNSSKFPDLCPIDNAENCEEYIDRLNELLINREVVKEIAITAPYSGGKSSFINTYMRLNPYHKYTCISLGAFGDDKSKKDVSDGTENINKIEKSIVQQILYKTNSESTPNSRFRKIIKSHPKYFSTIVSSVSFVMLAIAIAIISYIPEYSLKNIFYELVKDGVISMFSLVLIIYIISILILSIKDALKILPKFNLSKFNPLKGEVAFEQSSNDSVFNIFLEEIIYYFSKTKSDVVFFEDLDRFKCSEIFVQLKELNKLINDSADVKQCVRFIYALKDDVFKGSSRTKFFDAIIPIIPVTNKSNSFPLLKRLLEDSGFKNEFDDVYLRDIAVFVDDMRMLKNIVAEYGIYKSIIQKNIPNIELKKLFSFIIYKNIYCDDFSKLHHGGGKLACFFNKLKVLRGDFRISIESKINLIKDSIIDFEKEHLQTPEELNDLYLFLIIKNFDGGFGEIVSIDEYPIKDISDPENFESLMVKNKVYCKYTYGHHSMIMFADLINNIEPSYSIRKHNIENKIRTNKDESNLKIKDLKDEIFSIPRLSIKGLVEKSGGSNIFNDMDDEKLLIHMIKKGYIDEQYHLYISIFYEGNISKSDMDFIMAVKNNEETDPNKKLIDCTEILKYLSGDELRSASFFNYSMIDYLLIHEHERIVVEVIEYGLKPQDDNIDLIYGAIQELTHKEIFGSLIIDNWPTIWSNIISYKNITIEKRNEVLVGLLLSIDKNKINENSIESIKCYIDENENIVNAMPDGKNEKIRGMFKFFKVEFQKINDCADDIDFLNFIIKEELFCINHSNLLIALDSLSNKVFSNTFSLSDVYDLDDMDLINLIENNMATISRLIDSGKIRVGSKDQYRNILNNADIDNEVKQKIITSEEYKIDDLSEVRKGYDIWGALFENNKINPSWNNVINFIQSHVYKKRQLAVFLNLSKNYTDLLNYEMISSDRNKKIFVDCLISEDVNIQSFENLQIVVEDFFNDISLEGIVNDKLEFLIVNGNISVDKYNYKQLKDIDYSLSCLLLEQDFDGFLTDIDYDEFNFEDAEIRFSFDELHDLLISSKLTDKQKNIIILEHIENLKCAPDIISDLVISNFNEPKFSKEKISADLLEHLLMTGSSIEAKVAIYTNQIKNLGPDHQNRLLSSLGSDYDNITITRSNTSIPNTSYNLNLVNELKKHKLISSFRQIESPLGDKQLKVNAKRKK